MKRRLVTGTLCGVLSISQIACVCSLLDTIPQSSVAHVMVQSTAPATFTVEIADTAKTRELGLMGRKSLEQNHGMLFQFDHVGQHVMWMKNTYVSLDLLFLDDSFLVVGMIEHAEPLSEKLLSVDKDSRFVLEVSNGAIKKNQIKTGDHVRLFFEK